MSSQPAAALSIVILLALSISVARAGRTLAAPTPLAASSSLPPAATLLQPPQAMHAYRTAPPVPAAVRILPPAVPASTPLLPVPRAPGAAVRLPPPALPVPHSTPLLPVPRVPNTMGLPPPALPASTTLPPVPQVAAVGIPPHAQLAYHLNVTKSRLLIFIAGFLACALFVVVVAHYSKAAPSAQGSHGQPQDVTVPPVENTSRQLLCCCARVAGFA
jgi:hypothetical protein